MAIVALGVYLFLKELIFYGMKEAKFKSCNFISPIHTHTHKRADWPRADWVQICTLGRGLTWTMRMTMTNFEPPIILPCACFKANSSFLSAKTITHYGIFEGMMSDSVLQVGVHPIDDNKE